MTSSPSATTAIRGTVLSANIAAPRPCPTGEDRLTGIDKLPVAVLDVFVPGPSYGDGSGVRKDLIGDSRHHGGAQKAVYAFAREELDFWGQHNGERYTNGAFGENLTTEGIRWKDVLINQKVRIGSALLEVSVPRQPCRTFASWVGRKGWVKTFTARGDCGAYFRVLEPGQVRAGDLLEFYPAPTHDISMGEAFAAKMGDRQAAARVFAAEVLPGHHHRQLGKLLGLNSHPTPPGARARE